MLVITRLFDSMTSSKDFRDFRRTLAAHYAKQQRFVWIRRVTSLVRFAR